MIFVKGFVHCDPHPGNVLVRKCPQSNKTEIVLLDHGLYQVRHRPRPPQTRHRSKFITYYTPLFTCWLPGQQRTQACMCRRRLKAFHLSGPEALVCFKKCTFLPLLLQAITPIYALLQFTELLYSQKMWWF